MLTPVLAGDCPSAEGLCTLIHVARDTADANRAWLMGADVLGVSEERLYVRVSDSMLEELTSNGVAFQVVTDNIYQPDGDRAQARPTRRSESFAAYHDLNSVVATMQRIAASHPDIAAINVIGASVEGRSIYALRISDNADTIEADEPGMVVVGGHHAREWIGVEVPLYLADYLVDHYLKDGSVTRLIRNTEIWIIPVLNPDGFVYSWTEDRWWRKNRRDNQDGTIGVDLNRNYSIGFGDDVGSSSYTTSSTYRGRYPFSEPETQAIRDLMKGSFGRTFDASLSYHSFSQVVMYPNGHTKDTVPSSAFYGELAREMTQLINESHSDARYDYVSGQSSRLLYIANGDFTDWGHHEAGATSIIVELRPAGPPFFELPADEIVPTCRENLPAFLHMAERVMIPDLHLQDADLDGIEDDQDYCPNSPRAGSIDATGCLSIEQDFDGDGVINVDDLCRESLPNQQVDANGCRVETLYAIQVVSNIPTVEIEVIPPDIDAEATWVAGSFGFTREYAAETMVSLTAPATTQANRFMQWVVDGNPRPVGEHTVLVTRSSDVLVRAVYAVPGRVEIEGPGRVPDRRTDGLGFVVDFSARIVFTDGATEEAEVAAWSLSDTSLASITPQGELVVYDVDAQAGVVTLGLTAEIEFGDVLLVSEPFELTIFDLDTVDPRCREITLEGVDSIDSNSTQALRALVLVEGDFIARSRPEEIEWSLSLAGDDDTLSVPALVAADGTLTTRWVAVDTPIIVQAAHVNDDGTACLAHKQITIRAGDAADAQSDSLSPSNERSLPAICGAVGMVAFFGLMTSLIALRFTRR